MSKNRKLSVFVSGLLLLSSAVATAQAQFERRRGGTTTTATTRAGGDNVKAAEKPAETPAAANATTRQGGDNVSAPEVEAIELRCRGGENAFDLTNRGAYPSQDIRLIPFYDFDFKANNGPARSDGSGLEAGTCSLINRPLSATEPRRVHFDSGDMLRAIGAARERDHDTALLNYFKDPNHSWSFFVYRDENGLLKSTKEKVWIDLGKKGIFERLLRP